jgi:predicted RNA-binding protein YlqC (UPF0109 family)
MEETIQQLLKLIYGEESEFEIKIEEDSYGYPNSFVVRINTNEELKPQLIGRGGATIKSIHNIVNLIGNREGKRFFVKVQD